MNIKELFKMVENTNKLKNLMNEKELYIKVIFNRFTYETVKTYNEYKKLVKDEFLNMEISQDEQYKNSFYGSKDLEFNILEDIFLNKY